MGKQEEHIQKFYDLEPWRYQRIARYTWFLSHTTPVRRDLVLYLRDWTNPFNPLQLKLECYNVDICAYATIYFRGSRIEIQVHVDERMQYIFEDTYDSPEVLLKCQDFKFQLEHVSYEYL